MTDFKQTRFPLVFWSEENVQLNNKPTNRPQKPSNTNKKNHKQKNPNKQKAPKETPHSKQDQTQIIAVKQDTGD